MAEERLRPTEVIGALVLVATLLFAALAALVVTTCHLPGHGKGGVTMAIEFDADTGCEYLCGFYGLAGCTPRLGPDAKPICKVAKENGK